jgi:hypothetical protein
MGPYSLDFRRKVLHKRTAQALKVLYSGSLAEHYSDLAHHYSRSGNAAKAVEYLSLAGQQAAVSARGSHHPPHCGS